MHISTLFSTALHIEKPWFVKRIDFDVKQKKLNIMLDFVKGSTFGISGIDGEYKAYDTVEKSWRHLNFLEHECYLTARTPEYWGSWKTPAMEYWSRLPTKSLIPYATLINHDLSIIL